MQLVFMSAFLQDYNVETFKHKLGSDVKISDKETLSRKPCFSKLKCHQFLYKTSSLYMLSDSYTSKNILGKKKVWWKQVKKLAKSHIF